MDFLPNLTKSGCPDFENVNCRALIHVILILLIIVVLLMILSSSAMKLLIQFFTISIQLSGSYGGSLGSAYTANDKVYHGLLKWLGEKVTTYQIRKFCGYSEDNPNEKTTPDKSKTDGDLDSESDNEDELDEWAFSKETQIGDRRVFKLRQSPGYGSHFFRYKNRWILLERLVVKPKYMLRQQTSQEMLTLTVPWWNLYILEEILEAAKPKPTKTEKKLVMYKAVENFWSRLGGKKKKRPLDTIILSGEVIQNLLEDVKTFLSLENWYVERGIPYRRGYLLYGPPGNGKTSTIKALAGSLDYDICVFSLSQKLTDDSLCELLNNAPKKSIILMEDIDSVFKSREDPQATSRETNLAFEGCSQSALTFKGLLNALDGVASSEDGKIVFMTTNYPDKLDPALVRPGRVDFKVFIDYPNDSQLEKIFQRFYPKAEGKLCKKFVKNIRAQDDLKASMAMVQGLFLRYRNSPQDAIDKVEEHFKEQFSNVNINKPNCAIYM